MKGRNYYRLRKNVLKEIADSFSKIQSTYKYLKKLNKHNINVLGAGQWILDNTYLVEKEYKCIKKEMPLDYFKGLPHDEDYPRIFNVAKKYISASRNVSIENMEEYINRIQDGKSCKAFTMGELWAFPLMLKASLIINLSKYTEELREAQVRFSEKNTESNESQNNAYTNAQKNDCIEKNIGEYISCIRSIEAVNWRDFFKKTSLVEKILGDDPVNVYKSMDFESQDYYRHKVEEIARVIKRSEIEVAENALKLSEKNYINNGEKYKSHIGYYLIDEGTTELDGFFYTFGAVITEGAFLGINLGSTVFISLLILFISAVFGSIYTRKDLIIAFLLIFIPVNEVVVGLINWLESKFIKIRKVPKLDFSNGIPYDCKTVVVIPAIVDSKEKVQSLMEKLEVEYCGNMDNNIFYALLSDFCDSDMEVQPNESEIIDFAVDLVNKLNKKYASHNNVNEDRFYFLSRKRIFNEKQKVYMGKERKRGKLMEFMALIRGREEHTYNVISSDISALKNVKYLITLDEDTFMPRETVSKLVGAMKHILNVPYIKDNKVVRGYGIMQPKVSISLEAKNKTYFSKIFAGDNSVDGYSVAYSDTYEDLFGEGTFVGKGIVDIDEFYGRLKNTIKEDRVLSHDLLEGALCRCALVSDIEFIDDYPSFYESSCKRLHRWVRGDWQLIGWIFSKKISLLNKWKIIDNLRRSLLAPNLMLSLILSLTIFNGNIQITLLCFLALIMSLVFIVADFVVTPKNKLMGTFKTLKQIFLIISFIPYQTFLMADAIITTLIRMFITRRNLLEWQSSQLVENNCSNTLKAYIKRMWISPVMAVVIILLALDNSFGIFACTSIVAALWIGSPYIAYAVSCDLPKKKYALNYEEKTYLRQISRRIYAYYEDFINEENNYLVPDNYQVRPYKGVANRTSPTNMGMGIISQIAAYDLGYITLGEFIDKIDIIITNMNDLKREHGHFYNWYDTRTKEPLWPRYISTVDSGNLLANMWILKKSMEDLKNNPVIRTKEILALKDIYKIIEKEYSSMKIRFASSVSIDQYTEIIEEVIDVINKNNEFKNIINEQCKSKHNFVNSKVNEETRYWIRKLINEANMKKSFFKDLFFGTEYMFKDKFVESVPTLKELEEKYKKYRNDYGDNLECDIKSKINIIELYLEKIDKIIKYVDDITKSMNFRFLYDEKRGLFSIGYNVEEKSLGSSYYDLLASESRIASFVAIAKNDVPKEHWFKLGRAMTNAFHSHALVSWSGTMFEYFMPSLIMKSYPDTLLKHTYNDVLKAQRAFAKQKKIPWGISECAFYEFDNDENYQYKAFGIPGLGLKRGLEDEIVVSPYSTLMTLPFSTKKGFSNLNKLEKIGALGRYGFIEAIDYTKARKDNIIFTKTYTNYTQNVDNSEENVDKCEKIVDNSCSKYGTLCVNNVDKNNEKTRNGEMTRISEDGTMSDNPQKNKLIAQKQNEDSYPQEECSVFEDGIRPNKIMTYMVHHLGMSIMALENMLLNNILIERFHSLPQVKATELLLKERISDYVTYERYDDYTIRNKYIEGKSLLPRNIEDNKNADKSIVILSNTEYSIMLNNLGSGYSSLNDMMLYRWKGNSTSDSSGMFFYIKNLNSNEYWSATFEPCKTYGDEYKVRLDIDKPQFIRKDGNIETNTQISVSCDENFEVRKITLKNNGTKGRSIEVTSYMEIVLTSFSSDVVHPAFSNLFVQTEYDEEQNVIIGSRRGRVKDAKVPYIYHKVVCDSSFEGNITYETSRINFIGRNRTLKNPKAMDNDKSLENTVGTVLDPIISLRVRVRLEAYEEKELYFITGICNSKEEVLEICRSNDKGFKLERLFEKYHNSVQLELRNLEITPAEADAFQDLAYDIFYLSENRENRQNYIKNISKYQKDLWAFGISGDIPIVLVVIDDEKDINLVIQVLKFHYYIRNKGVKIDLIIYNNEELSYDEPLQKSLMSAINTCKEGNMINKPAGIHLYSKSSMNDEMRDFLIGICRVYINSKEGSLISQIQNSKKIKAEPTSLTKTKTKDSVLLSKYITDDEYKTENLDLFNGYGGFSKIDGSYIIKLSDYKNTPAPWINVMSNENFGFHISESGSSYTWCANSRENKITPWSNDYITDSLGEALYIRDDLSGNYFSISPKPVRDSGEYIIKHGFGYSEFMHSAYNIKGKIEAFVPINENVKVQKVSLENISDENKEISLFYYAKMVLGVYEYDSSKYITTEINHLDKIKNEQGDISPEVKYITANNPYSEYFGKLYAYLTILGGSEQRFTGDSKEFVGNNGELSSPEILEFNNDLSNRSGSIYDPCLVASTKITIPKGEKVELIILLGQEEKSKISKAIEKYTILDNAQNELEKVKEYWHNFLGNIQIKTPSKSMNYLLNGWLLYQTYSCRYLSRSAFYQSGGAYGFRDQLQDSMALGVVKPEITKDQILRSASRQYVEGDVQHWWHPVVNSGIRTRFSDDLLWLPYVTAEYINSTGDYDILEKTALYLEDEPLKEGEDEIYTIVNVSSQKGSIYEHCLKAIEKSLKFGPHNIPLMGSGDWNDGMSTVGNKGKGESVWLGWFIYSILDRFIKIAEYKNDINTKNHFEEKKEFIRQNIEKNAWDGGWYRRAYFDDGTPLGSRENPECQIDSIAQSWAVISGAAIEKSKGQISYTKRAVEALEAVDKNLVKTDKGMILLLAPPFNNSYLEPGYIKGYVPGVRENGGQYTHAAVWFILALTKLGLGDKAVKYYDMISPINHTNTELECMTYKLEPYVMAADVYIKEPHGGRGGWSWYTGASGWMYKIGIENILGLRKVENKGYILDPCVPKSWHEYDLKVKNETEDYLIHVKRRNAEVYSKEKNILINLIDGYKKETIILENNLIPRNLGKAEITVYFN